MTDLLDPLSVGTRADEITGDPAFLSALVDAELALTRALVATGIAPEWMLEVCGALTMPDLETIAAGGRAGGNPVIPLVKDLHARAEILHAGASDFIHVGATSQDILDTAAMLVARATLAESTAQLVVLGTALAALADAHRGTPMIGRTLGQQASPTTFGFVAAVWLDAVVDAIEALDIVLPAQLGGAVGNLGVLTQVAGENTPAVVEAYAAGLALANPSIAWHSNRSVVSRVASALGLAAGTAGLVALDVTVLARTEVGELQERLGSGEGGSSAMPHKRNPVTAVLVVGAARQAPALVGSLAASMLSEDQRPSGDWHAEWTTLRALERIAITATTGAASLAQRLEVDKDRMLANLELTNGLVFSERAATVLGSALGKTEGFDLVERAARVAFETGRPLRVVLSGLLAADAHSDELRSLAWNAFELSTPGQTDAAIDRVVARFQEVQS